MSAIGDNLRQAAQEADENPNWMAYAIIATKDTALRVFTDSPIDDQDEARAVVLRGLVNVAS